MANSASRKRQLFARRICTCASARISPFRKRRQQSCIKRKCMRSRYPTVNSLMNSYDEMMKKSLNATYEENVQGNYNKACFYALKHMPVPGDPSRFTAPLLVTLGVRAATKRKYNDANKTTYATSAAGIISFAAQLRFMKSCNHMIPAVNNYKKNEQTMRTMRGCLYKKLTKKQNTECASYDKYVDQFLQDTDRAEDDVGLCLHEPCTPPFEFSSLLS